MIMTNLRTVKTPACDITTIPARPQIIDKGIPTASLLAQVLIAKYPYH